MQRGFLFGFGATVTATDRAESIIHMNQVIIIPAAIQVIGILKPNVHQEESSGGGSYLVGRVVDILNNN